MFDSVGGVTEIRWRLADEEGEGPQGTLFDVDDLVEHHVGTGEFRGLEFLHVNARRIINEVPAASHMPFRFTINAYRGCSHACVYCLRGNTPILMVDGSTKALADLQVGQHVVGTDGRRLVPTTVLAHWETVKPAWRLTLVDDTEVIASGDHLFLTDEGWRPLSAIRPGTDISLCDQHASGVLIAQKTRAVEPLGADMVMYDITTGTGDFIANGVVSHNCFARPTHDYLGLNIGRDFETKIVVKVNAVERLRAELAAKRWAGHHIAMGTNTDPYQRCEGKYHLTQGIVRTLTEAANPFSILTKSTLVLRDLDLLAAAAERTTVRVNFSIGTLDEKVWKLTEPGAPHPRRRVEAVRKLNDAGIPCGVLIAPIVPELSDQPDQLNEVVDAVVDAGAVSVSAIGLHLRPGVKEHFMGWLGGARPDLIAGYEQRFHRSYQPKKDQDALAAAVRRMVTKARGR